MTDEKIVTEAFMLVYAEDKATIKKLGCMTRFEEAEIIESSRGQEYDDVRSWKVPISELQKCGIKSVMNEEGAARKRREIFEYKMMQKNDRYGY